MTNDYNGCSDPDYYDVEFREQNPEVYGNDELMQSYRGSNRRGQQARQGRAHRPTADGDRLHQQYLQWRRDHPDKIAFFRSSSSQSDGPGNVNSPTIILPYVVLALIVWPIIIAVLIQACE